MIIKNILNKIYIHPLTFLILVLSFLTGMFKEFFMVFLIIIFHELGHFFISYLFNWKFFKICIYPFGGCVKFEEDVNKSIFEEFLILLGGPLFQVFFYIFVYILYSYGFITYRNFTIFEGYHYTLLIFNLLPIYPLDGGRIFNLVCNKFLPFKIGNKVMIIVSFILLIVFFFFYNNFNFFLMALLILCELFSYFKNQDFLYNKMLYERYSHNYNFKKFRVINNKNNMYKGRRHVIYLDGKYITERDFLNDRYKVIK